MILTIVLIVVLFAMIPVSISMVMDMVNMCRGHGKEKWWEIIKGEYLD